MAATASTFTPDQGHMHEACYGVPMTCMADEDVLAVTGDRRRALAALNWYSRNVAETILSCPAASTAAINRHLTVHRGVFLAPAADQPGWAWTFADAPDHPQAVEVTILAATSHVCDPECVAGESSGLPYDLPEVALW
jgi:hypothetical protein